MIESRYLKFELDYETEGGTKVYSVLSKTRLDPDQSGVLERPLALGTIKWYGAWRQYVFFPDPQTVWNPTCMNEIAQFMIDLQTERIKQKQTKV